MRISDWSSDVCSSDLPICGLPQQDRPPAPVLQRVGILDAGADVVDIAFLVPIEADDAQAERVACQRNVDHSVIALPNAAAVGRHADIGQPGRVEARQIGTLRQDTKRSEEHTSELQSIMRTSSAVFCLQKKNTIRLQK